MEVKGELRKAKREAAGATEKWVKANEEFLEANEKLLEANEKLVKTEGELEEAEEGIYEIYQTLCERELAKSIYIVCGSPRQRDRIQLFNNLCDASPEAGKEILDNKFGTKMSKEVFEDFLVVLDTNDTGIMQRGNRLVHEFTIEQGRSYTKHPAFLFFLDLLSEWGAGQKQRLMMLVKGSGVS